MRFTFRFHVAIAAVVLSASFAGPARAAELNACYTQAQSLLDTHTKLPTGGDNDFFTKDDGTTPNILFVLDTSGSMRQMPFLPTNSWGCSDSRYNAVAYDGSTVYPDFDPTPDPSAWGGQDGLFEPGHLYRANFSATGFSEYDRGSVSGFCDSLSGGSETECEKCLRGINGENRGYFVYGDYIYFDGNFLNIFPPKYVVARKVFKDLLMNEKVAQVRMGILGFNGSSGGAWLHNNMKYLNPSCNLAATAVDPDSTTQFMNNRRSISGGIESLNADDFNDNTPLAETLLDVGQYYTNGDVPFIEWFGSGWVDGNFTSPTADNTKSICWACQFSSVVLVTDGEPTADDSIPNPIKNLSGPEYDCPGCSGHYVHKVAAWFWNRDLRPDWADVPKQQSLATYTVGFALDHPLLAKTAELGGGKYFTATTSQELSDALIKVVDDVINRAGSFTSSNLSTIQSQASQSLLIPRFVPRKDEPWQGQLFRFDFLSEFVIDYELGGDALTSAGYKSDFYLVDKGCETVDWDAVRDDGVAVPASCKPIREATEADQLSQPSLLLGRFYRTTGFDDDTLTTTAAVPFWEANEELVDRMTANQSDRKVFTAIYDDAGKLDVIPFDVAHAADLQPYLGLAAGDYCDRVAVVKGVETVTATECAEALIQFVRGCTFGDTGTSCTVRDHVLADIFHSAPTTVDPPTPKDLINTVFRNPQSMVTLAIDDDFPSSPSDESAYDLFAQKYAERDRVILVGSNGGMLHAFHGGEVTDSNGFQLDWSRGTGEELWAFIPPDLLPKLKKFGRETQHQFYVDGTPWVRNIWVDLDSGHDRDDTASGEPGEFRTVAVVGERRGGHHFFALDVTTAHTDTEPKLLWLFPDLMDARQVFMGETWNDITPIPPPIGPIRYKDDSSTDVPAFKGEQWTEKWIVALPGGYDPLQARGQGWFILDVWTGEPVWEFIYEKGSSDSASRDALKYSIAAPPALVAWGDEYRSTSGNTYFDTLVVGDTGGQLWVGRFPDPDPDTWAGARVFEPNKPTDTDPNKAPWNGAFFQTAYMTVLPESGYLRAYLGSGNRAHIRDSSGGTCDPQDPISCSRPAVCEKVEIDAKELLIGSWRNQGKLEAIDDNGGEVKQDRAFDLGPPDTSCPIVKLHVHQKFDGCPDQSANQDIDDIETAYKWECAWNSTTQAYECEDGHSGATVLPEEEALGEGKKGNPEDLKCVDTTGVSADRFYSVRVFGPGPTATDNLLPFATPAAADTFDARRLTSGVDGNKNVIPVTSADATGASSNSPGWYAPYTAISERTASPAVTAASCVVWSSLKAHDQHACTAAAGSKGVAPTDICASTHDCFCIDSTASQQAYMYFRNYVSGTKGCVSFENPPDDWDENEDRKDLGTEPQPPPPPQVIAQVSSGGQTKTAIATTSGTGVSVGESQDLLKEVNVVDVPRNEHDMRHAACQGDAHCD